MNQLTDDEMKEVARMLSCIPVSHDERVVLSAVRKLLTSYLFYQGMMAALEQDAAEKGPDA